MFGRSKDEGTDKEELEQSRRASAIHRANIAADERENTAEILRELSHINDLPIDPTEDEVVGQLISQVVSTANLSPEDVRSQEWVHQYILLLYKARYPPSYGISGDRRAWAYGDEEEYREPLDPATETMLETLINSGKLAMSRSEDFRAVEEATRTVSESVVRDESPEEDKGGLRGLLG